MPKKSNIIKTLQKHKVTNWSQYNKSLKQRGSLTIWISEDTEDIWYEPDRINDGSGNPRKYTDKSIQIAYELKLCFKQPLRQLEGLINSIFKLSGLYIKCPDYSTLSRRCGTLDLKMPKSKQINKKNDSEEQIITLDSSGLKQYGKDEWHQEKHKVNPRRTWRKVHIAVDEDHMIRATLITGKSTHDAEVAPELLEQIEEPADRYIGDGAYDTKAVYDAIDKHNKNAKIVILPRENAVAGRIVHPERNKTLGIIEERCRGAWCKMRKYGFQNYAELAIQRYKKIIGNNMHSRNLSRQKNESIIATSILNKFTQIGMPISVRIE